MTYQVLARKWRPKQFADVIGQEHVTRTLSNAITANRVAHAYLFVGPRGTGKTTTARIFAKALNCEKGPTATPCDACDACTEIMSGTALDVIEIDAASNTGVDNVRDLRDNVRYSPVRGPYKIYVIDEVHMLSTGAFNALLKTLEEPPDHVKFVLATTDPQKVPATIHSRCQRFDLRRIPVPVIAKAIGNIAKAEKIDIDEDALLAIARGADGGMRDAQSAMDQLIAFVGDKIREPDVLAVFGLLAREALEQVARAVLEGNISVLIERIAELDSAGKDMQRMVIELMECFRNVLICMYAPDAAESLDITGRQREALLALASSSDPARILRILEILAETENRLRYAISRRTLVETALIRCARAATVVSIEDLLKQINELKLALDDSGAADLSQVESNATAKKKSLAFTDEANRPASSPNSEPRPTQASDLEHSSDLESETIAVATEEADEPKTLSETPPPDDGEDEISLPGPRPSDDQLRSEHQRLFAHWHDLIEEASHAAPLIRSYLIDAKPVCVEVEQVHIGFDPEFANELENVDVPRNRKVLEKVLGRFLRRSIHVHFRILEAGETLPSDIHLPEGHTHHDAKDSTATDLPDEALTAEQRWIRDPVVRLTLEAFNGEIIDIRE